MRFGTSKKVESGMRCGNFFHSCAACSARSETFGIGDLPRKIQVSRVLNFKPFLPPVGVSGNDWRSHESLLAGFRGD